MKRVLLTLITLTFLSSSVFANTMTEEKISDAISLYKKGDYSECIKNLDTIISQDSSYPVAYYYLGLCYAKTHKRDLAIKNYDKVISLSTDKSLKSMAKAAKDCLGTSGFTGMDAQLSISNNSKAERFVTPEIKKENPPIDKKLIYQQSKKEDVKKDVKQPSNAEIGAAIMTLKKAGLWNGNNISQEPTQQQTPDNAKKNQDLMAKMYMQQLTQQMNNPAYLMMGMNGNNNNNSMGGMNMMNMLPFMMSQDGNSNPAANQQFIQTMMMSQMMPNFDFSSSDNK